MPDDNRKTKVQLLEEVQELRERVRTLERTASESDRAEHAAELRFKTFFEQSDAIYMILDPNTSDGIPIIVDANSAACEAHGYTRAEFIGRPVADIDDQEGKRMVRERTQLLLTGKALRVDNTHVRKDGTVFPVAVYANLAQQEGEPPLIFTTEHDITDRKRAEEALRESEVRLRAFLEASPDLMFETDAAGTLFDVQAGTPADLFREPQEFLGRKVDEVMPGDVGSAWSEAIRTAAATGAEHAIEYALPMPGGQRDFEARIFPTSADRLHTIVRDVTERKRAEEERLALERQVQQAQKLESLGVMAGGIAHDFNNLLTSVLGNAELAQMILPPESPALELLEAVRESALDAAKLTKQMLAYVGQGRLAVELLDLGRLVEQIAHLLEAALPKGVVLKTDFAPDLPAVVADAGQMRQVILNLIINAGEAIGDRGGIVTLSTGVMVTDTAYLAGIRMGEDLAPGDYVYLEVADTGAGMDAGTVAKIFDPFFTTKFQGRGLGLAAAQGIVHGHRGALKVHSEPGRGTTFKVLLPATESATPKPERSETPQHDTWRGTGTVLVVDDEGPVRRYAERVLTHLGFTVLLAEDGQAGLDVFRAHADEIVLVLLDMTMPHLDGSETFSALRSIQSDVRVILCSGYAKQDATRRFTGKGLAGFVQKPYDVPTLAAALRAALDT